MSAPLRPTRRRMLGGAGALALFTLTGCGTGENQAGSSSSVGGARRVEHLRGVTTVPADPHRIVTVGYSDQDFVLALGGRLAAVTDWYGDYPYATWPWAQAALGDQKPQVMNKGQFTGTPDYKYEEIAALKPDLILGLYTEMNDDQYSKLSRIAPTIAPPKGYKEFGAPWEVVTRLAGDAMGKRDEAEKKVAEVEATIARLRDAHPEFRGKVAYVVERFEQNSTFVRAKTDPRSQLLTGLGFTVGDEIKAAAGDGNDGATLADENMAQLDRDLLVWNIGSTPSVRADIEALPIYRTLKVVQEGHSVFVTDPVVSGAWTWGTVLSLPFAAEELVKVIAPALAR